MTVSFASYIFLLCPSIFGWLNERYRRKNKFTGHSKADDWAE